MTPALPAPAKEPSVTSTATQALDLLSKGLVSLSLFSFLAGLLIKNYYLLRFDVAQFEPFRSEYVATGLVWLILSASCVALVWNGWRWDSLRWKQATTKRQKWYELSLLPAAVFGYAFFVLFMLHTFGFNDTMFGTKAWLAAGGVKSFV